MRAWDGAEEAVGGKRTASPPLSSARSSSDCSQAATRPARPAAKARGSYPPVNHGPAAGSRSVSKPGNRRRIWSALSESPGAMRCSRPVLLSAAAVYTPPDSKISGWTTTRAEPAWPPRSRYSGQAVWHVRRKADGMICTGLSLMQTQAAVPAVKTGQL